jgi:hypothetical protein
MSDTSRFLAGIALIILASTGVKGAEADSIFRQLNDEWPGPTEQRLASGAPGPEYWQQRADYRIHVTLDEHRNRISGEETITYHNNSPHALDYLWMQVENQIFDPQSLSRRSETAPRFEGMSFEAFRNYQAEQGFDGSVSLSDFQDEDGTPLNFTRVDTNVRIDLPEPLESGDSMTFSLKWDMPINDATRVRARTGFEYFDGDGNAIYEMAHWYPRMVAYTDYTGWQHKSFLGRGEFTLEFGDFEVSITVPSDHVVAATGVLQNADEVLSAKHLARLEEARDSDTPVFIITEEEARQNQEEADESMLTWNFYGENVRDFAWASSRKFIWDAMGIESGGNEVLAMSFYPPEAEPLWSRYSTHAVAHTIDVYSKFTFDYPYPVAISVNGPVGGMEYPMICFNGPRGMEDGTYFGSPKSAGEWRFSKYGLISVIIHEVGHNYFPMIVNSDERRWTWMDEGLNTFLQYLAEQEWEDEYPSRRGEPEAIVSYMTSSPQVPIMTHSDLIHQFGSNAYAKPATALNVLRESVLGRDLFDFAFRQYSRRWMFKRPEPYDLFRTMEDASGVDLDWFWNGWFYSTDHCDIAITDVDYMQVSTQDPVIEKELQRQKEDGMEPTLSASRNKSLPKRTDRFPDLEDFYNDFDPLAVTPEDRETYSKMLEDLSTEEKDLLKIDDHFYAVKLENLGGLVSPVTLRVVDDRGDESEYRIPAEVWRRNAQTVSIPLQTQRPLQQFIVDPYRESPDSDRENNYFPRKLEPQRFELKSSSLPKNPMQKAREAREQEKKKKSGEGAEASSAEDQE